MFDPWFISCGSWCIRSGFSGSTDVPLLSGSIKDKALKITEQEEKRKSWFPRELWKKDTVKYLFRYASNQGRGMLAEDFQTQHKGKFCLKQYCLFQEHHFLCPPGGNNTTANHHLLSKTRLVPLTWKMLSPLLKHIFSGTKAPFLGDGATRAAHRIPKVVCFL